MKKYLFPLVCTHRNGETILIKRKEDIVPFLKMADMYNAIYYGTVYGKRLEYFSRKVHLDYFVDNTSIYSYPFNYLIKDDLGFVINIIELRNFIRDEFKSENGNNTKAYHNDNFRNGPVWGIGKCRHYGRRYRPDGLKKESDICEEFVDYEDGEVKVPGIRKKRKQVLKEIMDWDGLPRSDFRNRNWKKNRKTRWKA